MLRQRHLFPVLLVVLSVMLGACGGRFLNSPMVDRDARIPRSADSEAILEMMEQYAMAIDEMDVSWLRGVISRDYYENAGTTHTTEDDYGYEGVMAMFETLARHVEDSRVELKIRDIKVRGDRADVVFEYAYTMLYRVGESRRWQTQRDVNRVQLQRERDAEGDEGVWRIISGL